MPVTRQDQSWRWDLGRLPFYWRPLDSPDNNHGLPTTLPFALTVDPQTGRLVREPDDEVSTCLKRAYEIGSYLPGRMEADGPGKKYADAFRGFIYKTVREQGLDPKTALDVGCGTGHLLDALDRDGLSALGVDPGADFQNQTGYEVKIIRDFFPSPQIRDRFDLVTMFCLLEHIESPTDILTAARENLTTQGCLVLAVPDCTPYFATGDVSPLTHIHDSYFTYRSLAATLAAAGYDYRIRPADWGGILYAAAWPRRESRVPEDAASPRDRTADARQYQAWAKAASASLAGYLDELEANGRTLGIFVPSRIQNCLAMMNRRPHCRLFDDDPMVRGTYLPAWPRAIESRQDLTNDPPDELLICSRSFGENIRQGLRPLLPVGTVLRLISEFDPPQNC